MADFERPAADPKAIVSAWHRWTAGEEQPGRTMADLKIAGLDLTISAIADENEIAAALLDQWLTWEKAKATPAAALDALTEAGLDAFVEAIAAAI